MRPPVRLAAMMGLPIVYVWTHDSIYLGEDGPTHQPIEHLAALRAIPNLTVIRPADANETAAAWKVAMEIDDGPVALALSRQKLPIVTHPEAALEGVARGGYVLRESPLDRIDVIILATGSEIADALAAQLRLQQEGVGARVVSMPSWSLFEAQPEEYRAEVLPDEVTHRISVEAGGRLGWRRYVGEKGVVMGIDHFGASAPYKKLQQAFELSPEDIAKRALALIKGG
jgi:transketolase